MNAAIHDRLDAQFDQYSIERQLHDVPPHAVWAVTVNGNRAVYKADAGPTGNAHMEGRIIAFVGERTSVPVPTVCHVGEDYYVADWHPEAPAEGEQEANETWARAAGRCLATLHGETAGELDGYGQFRWDGDSLRSTGHDGFHAAAVEYVRTYRPTLDRYGHADIADAVIDFLRDHPDAIVDAGPAVCCHGWATPDHLSVVDGEAACLLDFEHAIAAPPAFDIWRTAGPALDDETQLTAFLQGYESVRNRPATVRAKEPHWELLNHVYYLVSLHVQDQHGPETTAEIATAFREWLLEMLDELD